MSPMARYSKARIWYCPPRRMRRSNRKSTDHDVAKRKRHFNEVPFVLLKSGQALRGDNPLTHLLVQLFAIRRGDVKLTAEGRFEINVRRHLTLQIQLHVGIAFKG